MNRTGWSAGHLQAAGRCDTKLRGNLLPPRATAGVKTEQNKQQKPQQQHKPPDWEHKLDPDYLRSSQLSAKKYQ